MVLGAEVKIFAGNVFARVEGDLEEIAWLEKYLSVDAANAQYSAAFRAGNWDGKVHFFGKGAGFSSGFVHMVVKRARELGKACVVIDERSIPEGVEAPKGTAGAWLRPDQREAVNACLERRRGIVVLPTGLGKTECFIALMQAVPLRWIVMVDTRDLLRQMAERFELRTGERAGCVGDGIFEPRRVTVATFQTCHKRGGEPEMRRFLEAAGGVVVDEAHILSGKEYSGVLFALPNAYYRLGFTATALDRGDEKDFMMIGNLGPVIHVVRLADAIQAGRLAETEIVMVRYHQPRASGPPDIVYEAAVTLNQIRNGLIASIVADERLCPRPTLVFVKAIQHGKKLEEAITKLGIRDVEYVHGQHSAGARKAAIKRLECGNTQVLITSKIFNKGIDIPSVESLFNAAGGSSIVDAMQKLGRGTRKTATKSRMRFWDIHDEGGARSIAFQAFKRARTYRERGLPVSIIAETDVPTFALPVEDET